MKFITVQLFNSQKGLISTPNTQKRNLEEATFKSLNCRHKVNEPLPS